MHFISGKIIRFVDSYQPGFVEFEFYDASGHRHIRTDKAPLFTDEMLNADSIYPVDGEIACELLNRLQDATGRQLMVISTASPHLVESTEGLSEFTLPATSIISTPD
jgi:hypothetical protein